MRPAELCLALVVLQIGGGSVAAQHSPKHNPQQMDQHFRTTIGGHRQISNQRRQLGTRLILKLWRKRRPCAFSTVLADNFRALILRDMGLDRRQFDDLMTVDLADGLDLVRLLGQPVTTMLALRWQDRDHFIYSLRLHQRAMVPIVAGLSARLTSALLPFLSRPLVPR